MINYLILGLLFLLVAVAVRSIFRNKGTGCGSCAGCSRSCSQKKGDGVVR